MRVHVRECVSVCVTSMCVYISICVCAHVCVCVSVYMESFGLYVVREALSEVGSLLSTHGTRNRIPAEPSCRPLHCALRGEMQTRKVISLCHGGIGTFMAVDTSVHVALGTGTNPC